MLIGYLPAASADLVADRKALTDAGCEQITEERAGAEAGAEPSELDCLSARLSVGDVVVVPRLDALGASLADVVRRVQHLNASRIGLRSLHEGLDVPAAGRDGLLTTELGVPPAQDAESTSVRPDGGSASLLRRPRRAGGRRPKLSLRQQATVADTVFSGRHTAAEMAREYRVSEATISRLLAAHRVRSAAASGSVQPMSGADGEDRIVGVLPLSALDERMAIVGTSGSGKTYAAKGLIERVMAGGGRVCIVDPLGVWWGLGKDADGADPPFPVAVFGGIHGDVPLDPGTGAALGRLVGTHTMACVVDVSDFGSAAGRRGFMTEFTEALYAANTEPLHLVLDEADLWAPQRTQPDGLDLLGRVEEIVRRGRVRGFVPWLITQRPAVLHKDVLSQADVLVSMKLTSSQDRAAVGRWIEGQADRAEGRRILGALPRLRRGEGWVWAPGEGVLAPVSFPRIRTLDSSQTPVRRDQPGTQRELAAVDPSAIVRALARTGVNGDE